MDQTPPTVDRPTTRLPLRSRVAVGVGSLVASVSRLSGLGSGSVIGGRASLLVEPQLLAHLAGGRRVALVSATNGKTTTCHMLVEALGGPGGGTVAFNALGANMGAGLVAALAQERQAPTAVLEVDERWVPKVLEQLDRPVLVLGNLSRDQLDRTQEVRSIALLWHTALERHDFHAVVANADDPLVAWAVLGSRGDTSDVGEVVWFSPGTLWTHDAAGCPACGGRISFETPDGGRAGWRCLDCPLERPDPHLLLDGDELVDEQGLRRRLELALPGRANMANAVAAIGAARAMGVDVDEAVRAVSSVSDVAGRYRRATIDGTRVRLLMAKNPAGWQEALEMLAPPPRPLVAAINARIADGRDPSWLWDVPFEQLAGRPVVAIGERRHDLAVRLHYAGVDHEVAEDLPSALAMLDADEVDYLGNYTAFQDELDRVGR